MPPPTPTNQKKKKRKRKMKFLVEAAALEEQWTWIFPHCSSYVCISTTACFICWRLDWNYMEMYKLLSALPGTLKGSMIAWVYLQCLSWSLMSFLFILSERRHGLQWSKEEGQCYRKSSCCRRLNYILPCYDEAFSDFQYSHPGEFTTRSFMSMYLVCH